MEGPAPDHGFGGGTLRWMFNKDFQIGIEGYCYQQSTYGYQKHQSGVTFHEQTIDQDGDGYDDYISFADYSFSAANVVGQVKIELIEDLFYFSVGAKIGIGGEEFTISRNQRNIVDGALDLLTGNSTWSRSFLVTGGYLGMQVGLDGKKNVFKLGLEAGFDYHLPLTQHGEWTPGVGIHKQENAPPSEFNSMNFWFSLGPQFHY